MDKFNLVVLRFDPLQTYFSLWKKVLKFKVRNFMT